MIDLGTTFLSSVNRCPEAIAITYQNKHLNYSNWLKKISSLAISFKKMGLKKGDKLITLLPNTFEACTIHWACQLTGIVIVPINWRVKSEEINFFLNNSNSKCIICDDYSEKEIQSSNLSNSIIKISTSSQSSKYENFKSLINLKVLFDSSEAKYTDCSIILYTSGTTGKPKGVPRSHFAERSSAIAHIAQNRYERYESTLGVMPLYHTMGVRSLLSMTLVNGNFVAQPKYNPQEAIELINQNKISSLYLVPTLYHDLINSPYFKKEKLLTCHKLGFAGAPMTDGLIKKIKKSFSASQLINHYGSSEIYTFTIEPNALNKPGSAGKAGINQNIRVVKINSRNINSKTKINEEGEIIAYIKNDEAFEGYLERPDADKSSIIDDWYFTKDTGYYDENGDLFVTGRVDDMIITGGENIFPIEIENVISLHPNVNEVVIVGLKDEKWGQKVTAFIKSNKKDVAQIMTFGTLKKLKFIEFPKKGLLELNPIIKKINKLSGGILLIDYGYLNSNNSNTIQAVMGNKKISTETMLKNLGKADITSLVNFNLLKEYFLKNNLKVKKVVTQRFFLERMGIIERAHILEKKRTNEEQKYMKETLSRLLEEKQMGSLFKVIFGYKNKNNNFFGFE